MRALLRHSLIITELLYYCSCSDLACEICKQFICATFNCFPSALPFFIPLTHSLSLVSLISPHRTKESLQKGLNLHIAAMKGKLLALTRFFASLPMSNSSSIFHSSVAVYSCRNIINKSKRKCE